MGRYRVKDRNGRVVAEGSFGSFGEAKAWAVEQLRSGDWTLEHRTTHGWVVVRHHRETVS